MALDEALQIAVREALVRAFREELPKLVEQLRPVLTREPDECLSLSKAASLVGVAKATVRKWVDSGRLRRYGEERVLRVRRVDLLAFLESQGAEAAGQQTRSVEQQAAEILGGRRSRRSTG